MSCAVAYLGSSRVAGAPTSELYTTPAPRPPRAPPPPQRAHRPRHPLARARSPAGCTSICSAPRPRRAPPPPQRAHRPRRTPARARPPAVCAPRCPAPPPHCAPPPPLHAHRPRGPPVLMRTARGRARRARPRAAATGRQGRLQHVCCQQRVLPGPCTPPPCTKWPVQCQELTAGTRLLSGTVCFPWARGGQINVRICFPRCS